MTNDLRLPVRHVRGSANETRVSASRTDGHKPLTGRPIDLDAHRTAMDRARVELRRRPINRDTAPTEKPTTVYSGAESTHSAQSPRAEIKAMDRALFLLRRFAASREGDHKVDKTIMRVESELARLRKREETRL